MILASRPKLAQAQTMLAWFGRYQGAVGKIDGRGRLDTRRRDGFLHVHPLVAASSRPGSGLRVEVIEKVALPPPP